MQKKVLERKYGSALAQATANGDWLLVLPHDTYHFLAGRFVR